MLMWITDSGHGWLKVPLSKVKELGIADKISACSYMDRTYAYLEEDCDAHLFLEAAQIEPNDIKVIMHFENAPIRNYARFSI